MPQTEDTAAEIAQWEQYMEDLRSEADQVKSINPTGYYAVNPRGMQQFKFHINKRAQSIRDDFIEAKQRLQKLYAQRDKAAAEAQKGAAGPKPMTEAQALAADDRSARRQDDVEAQTPQKKLAESRLEQMKAADAASAAGLGANLPGKEGEAKPQNLRDLLNKFTMRRDPNTEEYVFSRENTEGVLNAQQKRKAKELEQQFKLMDVPPEAIFGPGVPPPVWNKEGNSTGGANPFIGNKTKYDALRELYEGSQPRPNIELRVPTGTLNRVYQETAPAYGGALPGNPIAVDAELPEAKAFVAQQQSPEMEVPLAQQRGRMDIQANAMGAPIKLGLGPVPVIGAPTSENAVPITLGTGGAVGIPTIDKSPAGLGVPVPTGIRPSGELPPPNVNDISQIEAQPPMTKAEAGARKMAAITQFSPNAARIIAAAQQRGLDRNDPAVMKALQDDSYMASKAKMPGQLGAVADTIGNITDFAAGGAPYLGRKFAEEVMDSPQTIMNAYRTWQQQQAREEAEQQRADEARRAAGLEVLEAPPSV